MKEGVGVEEVQEGSGEAQEPAEVGGAVSLRRAPGGHSGKGED